MNFGMGMGFVELSTALIEVLNLDKLGQMVVYNVGGTNRYDGLRNYLGYRYEV